MRYILTFKLKDSTDLICITDGINKDRVLDYCVGASHRIFNPSQIKFRLSKKTPYSIESWNVSRETVRRAVGRKQYAIIVFNGRSSMNMNLLGDGIKSVYSNIHMQYGNMPIVFMYDNTQIPKKKSSKAVATKVINEKDREKTSKIMATASQKASEMPGLGPIAEDVVLLCNMVYDYSCGMYREIPVGTIVAITAAIIYFVSPVDIIPDVVPVAGQMDDVAVITYAVKATHDDLQAYKVWRNNRQASKR